MLTLTLTDQECWQSRVPRQHVPGQNLPSEGDNWFPRTQYPAGDWSVFVWFFFSLIGNQCYQCYSDQNLDDYPQILLKE